MKIKMMQGYLCLS